MGTDPKSAGQMPLRMRPLLRRSIKVRKGVHRHSLGRLPGIQDPTSEEVYHWIGHGGDGFNFEQHESGVTGNRRGCGGGVDYFI